MRGLDVLRKAWCSVLLGWRDLALFMCHLWGLGRFYNPHDVRASPTHVLGQDIARVNKRLVVFVERMPDQQRVDRSGALVEGGSLRGSLLHALDPIACFVEVVEIGHVYLRR